MAIAQGKGGSRFFRQTLPRRIQPTSFGESDVGRGMQAGQAFGGLLGQLGTAIKSAQADKVANQLLAQQYPDQPGTVDTDADLSTDLPENVDPSIGGTGTEDVQGNFQGGVAELKARQSAEQDALDIAYKRAQTANQLAEAQGTGRYAKRATPAEQGVTLGAGSASRWSQYGANAGDGSSTDGGYGGGTKKSGKPAPYVPGSVDAEEDDSADDINKVSADFDAAQGGRKGTFANFLAQLPTLKPDANGNYTLKDKDGNPTATVLASDVPYWIQRTNAARRAQGLTPMQVGNVPFGQGANPASTVKPGSSADNPIVLTSKLQVRALPYGTYVKDPNTGVVSTVDRPKRQ